MTKSSWLRRAQERVPNDALEACDKLRQLAEIGARDEVIIRNIAESATQNFPENNNIKRVRDKIVDVIIRIEMEKILGGSLSELRQMLESILNVIERREIKNIDRKRD